MAGAHVIVCTICARGGSKGIPNKNIRSIAGKPLIQHTIEQAKAAKIFDEIGVSSDSPEILGIARSLGIKHLVQRPAELASDTAGKVPAIRHCAEAIEAATGHRASFVVDMDATSPLRSLDDIRNVIKTLKESTASNVITGMPARRSPYFNLVELDQGGVVHLSKAPAKAILRRQDAPACFDLNASIFAWRREPLFFSPQVFYPDTRLYVMPEERSIDIDSELDFQIVEFLLRKRESTLE